MSRTLVVVSAVLAVSTSALAVDRTDPGFEILSEGATTCGEYIAQPATRGARMEWVLGYISGRNREAASPRERMIGTSFDKPATIDGWLLSYCQSHSLDTMNQAADDLRADFLKREQGR
jgi:hypothetical protein